MSSTVKNLMTVADFEALPYDETHRYELIEGELYVSPAPGLPHQRVLRKLLVKLDNYLSQNPVGEIIPGPNAILSNHDWVIPDIVFVSKERWDSIAEKLGFYGAPDLMIEILSPGVRNRSHDLKLKRKQYGKFGVQEYWVVDVEARCVMIFHLDGDTLKDLETLKEDNQLQSTLLPEFTLTVSEIFK